MGGMEGPEWMEKQQEGMAVLYFRDPGGNGHWI